MSAEHTWLAFDDEMWKLGSALSVLTHPSTLGAGLGAGGVALANELHSVVDPAEQQKPRSERLKELGLGAGIGAVTHPLLMRLVKRGSASGVLSLPRSSVVGDTAATADTRQLRQTSKSQDLGPIGNA